jgi:hypothetical protein
VRCGQASSSDLAATNIERKASLGKRVLADGVCLRTDQPAPRLELGEYNMTHTILLQDQGSGIAEKT